MPTIGLNVLWLMVSKCLIDQEREDKLFRCFEYMEQKHWVDLI